MYLGTYLSTGGTWGTYSQPLSKGVEGLGRVDGSIIVTIVNELVIMRELIQSQFC